MFLWLNIDLPVSSLIAPLIFSPRIASLLLLHMHNLNHVQINRNVRLRDALDGVDDGFGHCVGEVGLEFGAEGGVGNGREELAVGFGVLLGDFEGLGWGGGGGVRKGLG